MIQATNQKKSYKKKERQIENAKIIGGGFRAGGRLASSENAIFRDLRGGHVTKLTGSKENACAQNFKSTAEMILLGRDFKKSSRVWKPVCQTSKVIVETLHSDLKYIEEGECGKTKKAPLMVWK